MIVGSMLKVKAVYIFGDLLIIILIELGGNMGMTMSNGDWH